jgi:hypothetical protein
MLKNLQRTNKYGRKKNECGGRLKVEEVHILFYGDNWRTVALRQMKPDAETSQMKWLPTGRKSGSDFR